MSHVELVGAAEMNIYEERLPLQPMGNPDSLNLKAKSLNPKLDLKLELTLNCNPNSQPGGHSNIS